MYTFRTRRNIFAGWIVTFVEQKRGGGHSSGYITSGFFGGKSFVVLLSALRLFDLVTIGIALGRILLMWLNRKASPDSR